MQHARHRCIWNSLHSAVYTYSVQVVFNKVQRIVSKRSTPCFILKSLDFIERFVVFLGIVYSTFIQNGSTKVAIRWCTHQFFLGLALIMKNLFRGESIVPKIFNWILTENESWKSNIRTKIIFDEMYEVGVELHIQRSDSFKWKIIFLDHSSVTRVCLDSSGKVVDRWKMLLRSAQLFQLAPNEWKIIEVIVCIQDVYDFEGFCWNLTWRLLWTKKY